MNAKDLDHSHNLSRGTHRFNNITAIRYGDENGDFDEGAPSRIAQFVLGHDIDTRVTVLNERLTAVVMPVNAFWDPKNGLADLIVTDTKSGSQVALQLGQWLGRYPSGILRPLSHNVAIAGLFPKPPEKSFDEDLTDLLAKHKRGEGVGVPDHILSGFLSASLRAYTASLSANTYNKTR